MARTSARSCGVQWQLCMLRNVRIAVSRKSTERQQSTHKILLLMLTPVKYNWLKAGLASWEYKRRN